jgi:hypothetical protein
VRPLRRSPLKHFFAIQTAVWTSCLTHRQVKDMRSGAATDQCRENLRTILYQLGVSLVRAF